MAHRVDCAARHGTARSQIVYCMRNAYRPRPEMEAGLRVTGSAILAGSGRVTGQCVRPDV